MIYSSFANFMFIFKMSYILKRANLAQFRFWATPASVITPTGRFLTVYLCPVVTDRTCQCPLPALFNGIEVIHLGYLLQKWAWFETKMTLSSSNLQGRAEAHRTPQQPLCFQENSLPISGQADSRDPNTYDEETVFLDPPPTSPILAMPPWRTYPVPEVQEHHQFYIS